jgi:hypothetical protein
MSKLDPLLKISASKKDNGELVGRHPAEVSLDFLILKFSEQKPLKALRARCLDCCCGDASEVRKCVSTDCAARPFRMGSNPFRKKAVLSDAERQRRTALLQGATPTRSNEKPRCGLQTAPRHNQNPLPLRKGKWCNEDTP